MIDNNKTVKNTVFRRLKYLVLLQAGEKFRNVKVANKKKLAFKIFLGVLAAAAVTFVIYFVLNYIKSKFSINISENLFTSVVFITQVISIITCIGSMMAILYENKENLILMAFPCKYNEIFISKIIVFTIEEMKKSCFFVIPFLLSYGVVSGASYPYWLQIIPVWIFMTLFPVLVSAILSIPSIFIKKFLENHSLLYAGCIVVLLVGLFALVIYVLSLVPTPIRLVALYDSFMKGFNNALVSINRYAAFYNFIGRMMFGIKVYMYLPIVLLILVVTAVLCFLIAMPFYFKAASSSTENSVNKKHKILIIRTK